MLRTSEQSELHHDLIIALTQLHSSCKFSQIVCLFGFCPKFPVSCEVLAILTEYLLSFQFLSGFFQALSSRNFAEGEDRFRRKPPRTSRLIEVLVS